MISTRAHLANWSALGVLCLFLLGAYGGMLQEDRRALQLRRTEVSSRSQIIEARVEAALDARIHLTRGLVSHARLNPTVDSQEFDAFAADLMTQVPGIRSLQLAPDAVVTFIYPLEGNRAALGHDLRADPKRRPAVEQTIAARDLVLQGPVTLKQGGTAVIGRTPIFHDVDGREQFWGLAVILLDWEPLMEEAGWPTGSDIQFALRGKDGKGADGDVIQGEPEVFERDPVISEIQLPVGHWELAAVPTDGWPAHSPYSAFLFLAMTSLGLLLAGTTRQIMRQPIRLEFEVNRAVRELRESELKFESLAESSPVGIYRTDLNGNLIYTNQPWRRILGVDETEIDSWTDRILPDLKFLMAERKANVHARRPYFLEFALQSSDGGVGTQQWVVDQAVPERNESDELVGYVGTLTDITVQKQALLGQVRLGTAVEQAAESIVITDTEGTIEYVNPAFERITGYSQTEAVGRNLRFLQSQHNTQEFYDDVWRQLSAGKVWKGRYVDLSKSGEEIHQEATVSPIRSESMQTLQFVRVARDIRRETELESQVNQLQKLEAIGRLAGGIAHDFNNILQVVAANAHMVLAVLPDDESVVRDDVVHMLEAAEKGSALTKQLLAFGRRQHLQREVAKLDGVFDSFAGMVRRVIDDIDIRFAVAPNTSATRIDRGQIEQVLLNLLLNARDAVGEQGQREDGRILVEAENVRPGVQLCQRYSAAVIDYVRISVRDNGAGMDSDTLMQIFEPFFTTKGPERGTGLGLAMVYGIVVQHGGFVHVESELGEGTSVEVYLPATQEDEQPAAKTIDTSPTGHETILLVDDELAIQRISQLVLQRGGYTVLCASTGAEALDIFQSNPDAVDLMVLDWMMPGMSGRAVADVVRETHEAIPILFCTGYGIADFELGKHEVLLAKPFKPPMLLSSVRALLDGRADGGDSPVDV